MSAKLRPLVIGFGFFLSGCCAVSAIAGAAEVPRRWLVLPATPALPQAEKTGFVQINGIRLWYGEYGVRNHGVPVLLLHGGLASSNYYGYLIPVLIGRGYHVIAADSRGQGRSTRTAEPLTYHLMASDVLGLMNRLNLVKADVAGWSDGAIIGLELAMTHPERVSRLFAFGANVDPSGTNDNVGANPVFAEYLRRTKQEYEHLSSTPDQYGELRTQVENMWSHEPHYSREQLAKISIPVTIADGQYDEAIRADHDVYMANAIPAANVVFLPNVSHFAMLQNPGEFADAVIDFLKYR
jgi:pimeloyl-ACP methyl ester carboxylesterase